MSKKAKPPRMKSDPRPPIPAEIAERPARGQMREKLDSRFPKLEAAPQGAIKIKAELRGDKLPSSPHARCDMLDAAAESAAAEKGLAIVGVANAGDAVASQVEDHVDRQVERQTTEPPAKKGDKPVVRTITVTERVAVEVATLAREYWAAPQT